MAIKIQNIKNLLTNVCFFNATPGNGYTRVALSKEDIEARQFLIEQMALLKLQVKTDSAGNIIGTLPGSDPTRKPIWIGSHIDTVIHGGMFDGLTGVACALEIIRVIKEESFDNKAPISAVIFSEEEGIGFGSTTTGSKALTGLYTIDDMKNLKNDDGLSYYQALKNNDINPDNLPNDILKPDDLEAMFELHVEQSPYLDSCNLPIGIVQAIAGIRVSKLTLRGTANHAGSTPMCLRQDSMVAAAEVILSIEKIAKQHSSDNVVATVGKITCSPNVSNVISGEVSFTVDVRDIDTSIIKEVSEQILSEAHRVADTRQITLEVQTLAVCEPGFLSDELADLIAKKAVEMGLPFQRMHSGAVHDASVLASVVPVGFLFVPSIGGFSHSPKENTHFSDIEQGCTLLLDVVKDIAA